MTDSVKYDPILILPVSLICVCVCVLRDAMIW